MNTGGPKDSHAYRQVADRMSLRPAKYRADIDGLRAIAVLSIVIFHAFPAVLPGGFIGVDIFYVISGYLITQILAADMASERYSLAAFYERRIRRIFPALFVMLAVSTAVAAAILAPSDLASYCRTAIAAALFSSNILLALQDGYFAPAADLNGLLQTWSLAVEEQFYIIFPSLLFLARRWRLQPVFIAGGIAVSLGLGIVGADVRPTYAFYLLPTRGWELLAGAALALNYVPWPSRHGRRQVIGIAGLVAITVGFFVIDGNTPFPGTAALLPCVGAMLVILAGRTAGDTITGRLLSARPMVGCGRMSYSLYLWHWPALVFLRYAMPGPPSALAIAAVVGGFFIAAYLSWRFIEQPFRHGYQVGRGSIVACLVATQRRVIASGLAIAVLLAAAFYGIVSVATAPAAVARIWGSDIATVDAAAVQHSSPAHCLGSAAWALDRRCRLGNARIPPRFAIWGDSVADSLSPAYGEFGLGTSGLNFVMHGCPSILGATMERKGGDGPRFAASCRQFNQDTIAAIGRADSIEYVVLADSFDTGINRPPGKGGLEPNGSRFISDAARAEAVVDRVVGTIIALRNLGKKVIVVDAYYAAPVLGAKYELRRMMRGDRRRDLAEITLQDFDRRTRLLNDRLKTIDDHGVVVVDTRSVFCPNAKAERHCRYDQAMPLTVDGVHFTPWGRHLIAMQIRRALSGNATAQTGATE